MPDQQLSLTPDVDRLAAQVMARAGDPSTGLHGYGTIPVAERTWMLQLLPTNVGVYETDEGVVLVDTGCPGDAVTLVEAVRELTDAPLHTVVFTHGHLDHAFGLRKFLELGETPEVIAHENTPARFERYMRTAGYNSRINSTQFQTKHAWWPSTRADFAWPTRIYRDALDLEIGGELFSLRHGMGETDDATWVHVPSRSAVSCGDFWFGVAPNCGNPQKVQRYPVEWAEVATAIAGVDAEHLLPGHNAYQRGVEVVRGLFESQAEYLTAIVDQTLDALNEGLPHDEIVSGVTIPEHLAKDPFLQPAYDRPEFISRNVIRRYGGWWSGYAAELLPVPMRTRAGFVSSLAGGASALAAHAETLAETDLQLACQVAEWAYLSDPSDPTVRRVTAEVFEMRAQREPSVMARGIYRTLSRRASEG